MTREQLVAMARRGVEHWKAGTVPLAPGVQRVPASQYVDPERFAAERDRIFRRLPLVLATSADLPGPGDYRTVEVLDTPVLLVRGDDGGVRAFVNQCSHRGAMVADEPCGTARRFTCPYHAWVYDRTGALVGLRDAEAFGDLDRAALGLSALPVDERAGLVWVSLRPDAPIDVTAHLCGYDKVLADLGLDRCHLVGREVLAGPNWKLAYDGYLDYYHLPSLHRDSFGPEISTQAIYDAWGPHQRVTAPDRHFASLADRGEDEWSVADLTRGVWTVFPHVSIASFDAGGRMYLVSQLVPGATVDSSVMVQTFLHERPPDEQDSATITETMAFLTRVVRDEDYALGLRTQRALRCGAKADVLFSRNEGWSSASTAGSTRSWRRPTPRRRRCARSAGRADAHPRTRATSASSASKSHVARQTGSTRGSSRRSQPWARNHW